jgi:type II secretory pathway pseudopilin PulG
VLFLQPATGHSPGALQPPVSVIDMTTAGFNTVWGEGDSPIFLLDHPAGGAPPKNGTVPARFETNSKQAVSEPSHAQWVRRQHRVGRRAFTLIEAMVSTAILVTAGSALLLGISTTIHTTNDAVDQAQATGMAAALMDEVIGCTYCADLADPYQLPLGPNAYEAAGACRERYNDIDDFAGITSQPPKDMWGIRLGTEDGQGGQRDPNFRVATTDFASWQQAISVYYVNPANLAQALPAGQTSDLRAVEVRINVIDPLRGTRNLSTSRRVISYVPDH